MVQLQTCLINKYTLYSIYAACVGLCVCVCTASLTGRNKFKKKIYTAAIKLILLPLFHDLIMHKESTGLVCACVQS